MEFIDNPDLRQWVKKSLRRALFQKAHELAVQTGCEVLLKVQDINSTASDTQYYATHTLKRSYDNNRLCKRSGETLIAGLTGLPAAVTVDRGSQVADTSTDTNTPDDTFPSEDDHDNDNGSLPDLFHHENSMNTDDVQSTSNRTPSERSHQSMSSLSQMNSGMQQVNNMDMDDDDDEPLPLADESKIDLTQDSDSDDDIVEVGEIKQESRSPGFKSMSSPGFKQESSMFSGAGQSNVYTHPNPYQCGVCQKAFANVQMLEHHNKTDHAAGGGGNRMIASNGGAIHDMQQQQEAMLSFKLEPNRYTCIRCQTTFNDSTRLHNHMTQCHMAALPPTSSTASIQQQFTSVRSPQSSPARMPPSSIASAGSPLPQISSVTSLRLMPGGMNMPSPSSPSPAHLQQQQPVPTSIFQSPVRSRNPSASSPAASPRGSPHGASPRMRKTMALSIPTSEMTDRIIMAAILKVSGPLTIHAVVEQASEFCQGLMLNRFAVAAEKLVKLKFGKFVTVRQPRGNQRLLVFVKASPASALEPLSLNPDLCTLQSYTTCYYQPTSRMIPQWVRDALVYLGHASDEMFLCSLALTDEQRHSVNIVTL